MEVTNFERVTVEEGRKSVRVCNWGSHPCTRVERKNGTFAWVPNGFKCITKEAGVQLVAETRVDEQDGTVSYRFSSLSHPEKVGEWRPNPTAALDFVQALLKNTKHRVGANGNVVLGVTYDNLQRRIIAMNGLDTTGTAVSQPPQYHPSKSQPPPAAAARSSSRSRTCKQKKSKKRSISQTIHPLVDQKMTTDPVDEQQKMDVEDGFIFSLVSDLEEENNDNSDSPSKRMRPLSIDDEEDKVITMNEDDFLEFDFPIDQGLDSSTFDVTATDEAKNDRLSEDELDMLPNLDDDDIDGLRCDLKLTPVSGAMLDQVEEPNKPLVKAKYKEEEEEEYFPEEKKKEPSTSDQIDNAWAVDWSEDEEFFFLPADELWIGPE